MKTRAMARYNGLVARHMMMMCATVQQSTSKVHGTRGRKINIKACTDRGDPIKACTNRGDPRVPGPKPSHLEVGFKPRVAWDTLRKRGREVYRCSHYLTP